MNLINQQRQFFQTGATLDVRYRIRQLHSLYQVILQYQDRISEALYQDLCKSEQEAYLTEIGMVLSEISYVLRHIHRWSRPKHAAFSVSAPFSRGKIMHEPYGVALILSPFNYPFQLAFMPLISALAAGNCVILKPSELAPATANVIDEMLNNNFEQRLCAVVTGGAQTAEGLVHADFDYIFFTGGSVVGKKVYAAAAANMIPITLELGGKSPCVVEKSADLELAAKRIVWGKFLNAGQTCVAPDYLLVEESIKDALIEKMRAYILQFYGSSPEKNPNYPKIINQAHFERLCDMLDEGALLIGGKADPQTLKIAPTILENAPFYSKLLSEEIFGPILPIIEYSSLSGLIDYISRHEKPLALYVFTQDKAFARDLLRRVPFGGGCVNDTIMHLCAHSLPFGGVGGSGMGSSHGKAGFDTFTHEKSILIKWPFFDVAFRYPPFSKTKPIVKRILK